MTVQPIPRAWLPGLGGRPEASPPDVPLKGRDRSKGADRPVHILLIEDDTTIADMYRVQLEYDGYKITVAGTAEAGLSSMAAASPDIVLLDLLLPDRSGLEVMEQITQTFPSHPPVVILSNYGEPTMIERGLAMGAVEYLVKSRVTPETVSRSIRGWIDQDRSGEPPRRQ